MNEKDIEKMFQDFNVENEDELFDKLDRESRTMICSICGKTMLIEDTYFFNDDPICKRCKLKEINL